MAATAQEDLIEKARIKKEQAAASEWFCRTTNTTMRQTRELHERYGPKLTTTAPVRNPLGSVYTPTGTVSTSPLTSDSSVNRPVSKSTSAEINEPLWRLLIAFENSIHSKVLSAYNSSLKKYIWITYVVALTIITLIGLSMSSTHDDAMLYVLMSAFAPILFLVAATVALRLALVGTWIAVYGAVVIFIAAVFSAILN